MGDSVAEGLASQSIVVDGQTVAPLKITFVNSTPQEMNDFDHEQLREHVEVVGRTASGMELIRRHGGADQAGNDAWRHFMRRMGRLR